MLLPLQPAAPEPRRRRTCSGSRCRRNWRVDWRAAAEVSRVSGTRARRQPDPESAPRNRQWYQRAANGGKTGDLRHLASVLSDFAGLPGTDRIRWLRSLPFGGMAGGSGSWPLQESGSGQGSIFLGSNAGTLRCQLEFDVQPGKTKWEVTGRIHSI